jgi:hypothetical protein
VGRLNGPGRAGRANRAVDVGAGDVIALDAHAGRLDVLLTDDELSSRRTELMSVPPHQARGHAALYVERVLQAGQGCDFDFLVGRSQRPADEPDAIFDGWVGGW